MQDKTCVSSSSAQQAMRALRPSVRAHIAWHVLSIQGQHRLMREVQEVQEAYMGGAGKGNCAGPPMHQLLASLKCRTRVTADSCCHSLLLSACT